MDQLTAYKVLGLQPECTKDEIKEAYATLSKEYHPEEHPEEFQRIHEAYSVLVRKTRRGESHPINSEPEKREEIQKEPQYSFEDALEKAKREEQARLYELVLEASAELKVLVSPKYKSNVKAYKELFEDKKYEPIIRRADFLERLCDVLEDSKLTKKVYDYIIEFYRLRGRNLSELSQIGLRLYQILDKKAGMKKANPGLYSGIIAAIVASTRVMRPFLRESQMLGTIVLMILIIVFMVFGYKKLKQVRSNLFAQAVIALGIAFSQFAVIMFDAYGTLFGSVDAGNSVAAIVFMIAMAWFVITVLIACIRKVLELVKRK